MSRTPQGMNTSKGFFAGLWARFAEKAGRADSAVLADKAGRAEKDINGNIIHETYAKTKDGQVAKAKELTFTPISFSKASGTTEVDVSSLTNGLYLATFTNGNGTLSYNHTGVIEFSNDANVTIFGQLGHLYTLEIKSSKAKILNDGEVVDMAGTLIFYKLATV